MDSAEIVKRFKICKLRDFNTLEGFDCGDKDLNDFLMNDSSYYRDSLLAVTYLLIETATNKVSAYFSLANDRIGISDFPENREFNKFRKHRFVNSKRLKSYPAAKICRLAIAESFKGQALGSFLLSFIKTFFVENNKTGCRFLTVDAYQNAIPFYEKNQFVFLSDTDKDSQTRLLFFDLMDIDH
jgi:GNAT superfamily N-acetyltransferase